MRRPPASLSWMALPLLCTACAVTPVSPAPASHAPSCAFGNEAVERDIGYCQALRVGNTLYISGVPGRGPIESAIPKVYGRLQRILEANGLSFRQVVKETLYSTNLQAVEGANALRKAYYDGWVPAATWVQVQQLFDPDFVLEVDLVAQYP
jgi:2-iminobutanoate/2-iminopropanoate deaminase